MKLETVVVALGSNLGDREGHLNYAVSRLRNLLQDLRMSTFEETEPVGVGVQPRFLNAVGVGYSEGSPRVLLNELRAIEQERARERPFPGAPRTLDLDLILVGGLIVNEPDLILPHPRFRERLFVLEPLAEMGPDLIDPVTGLTTHALLERLRQALAGSGGLPNNASPLLDR